MSIELLHTLSLAAYILAGVMLMLAVILFFVLDIRKVLGDVTGATARKAIENIRQQNEASGEKIYKPSKVNAERGMVTDKISASGRLQQRLPGFGTSPATEKFDTAQLNPQSNETTLLGAASNETTLLSGGEASSGETTLLSTETAAQQGIANSSAVFTIDVEMKFVGSTELIE